MSRHTQYECYALAPNAFICSCHFINTVGTGAKRASLSFSSAVQLVFFLCTVLATVETAGPASRQSTTAAAALTTSAEPAPVAFVSVRSDSGPDTGDEGALTLPTASRLASTSSKSGAWWQARQVATYLSAPPITSTAVSVVNRRLKQAGRPQPVQTAVSFVTSSARGTSSQISPNGLRWKSPSSDATITSFPAFA